MIDQTRIAGKISININAIFLQFTHLYSLFRLVDGELLAVTYFIEDLTRTPGLYVGKM